MAWTTPWFSGHQHPVRKGWYERDYTGIFGGDEKPHVHLDLWLQKSPGDGLWYVDEPKGQINDAYYECLPWRGLSSNDLGEGRERGILREASSGEAATSTDGLGNGGKDD
jgi:hypothetical protein